MTEIDATHVYSSLELNQLGYSSNALTNLIRKKELTRVQRGFYVFKRNEDILFTMIELFPEVILCFDSALYYHGYLKELPNILPVAVSKNHNRQKYKHSDLPIKAYFRDDKYIQLGVVDGIYEGLCLQTYDKERTICDCIRRKELLDKDIYQTALKEYAKDPNKNVELLKSYAKELRIEEKVNFYIESML